MHSRDMPGWGRLVVRRLVVRDLRFPTSLQGHGSDAMHVDPDYSCAYVEVVCEEGPTGCGLAFTLGRGTNVVVEAIKTLEELVVGRSTREIFDNFGAFWKSLTSHSQLRWLGPDKGVMHMACGAVVSGLWDLWAKLEGKPLWKLLVDMSPEQLVSTIDFTYIEDVITREEAVEILKGKAKTKEKMEAQLKKTGYPAYTTQVGWLGYSDDKVKELCQKYLEDGFTGFKVKVGEDLRRDQERCRMVREIIGPHNHLMVDANQRWGVEESVRWVRGLREWRPLWVEEPTSPDDILGHATIARELEKDGIGVASGEMCSNKVMFKQLLTARGISFCQVDACRLAGPNEILAVYLMAYKLSVGVCPHGGGVGLCEMVQHLQMWDFCCLSQDSRGRWIEFVDQEHSHFVHPVRLANAHYLPPQEPGYSTEMKAESVAKQEYPLGELWRGLIQAGVYPRPT